jgi:hypothetical protein
VYDTLLFIHVLAAFILGAAVVLFSAYTLGAERSPAGWTLACRLEDIGGTGTLVFGIWLALYVDGYAITDGWIIAAIVIWAAAGASGNIFRKRLDPVIAGGGAEFSSAIQQVAVVGWVRSALFVLLLADMIWKPGA